MAPTHDQGKAFTPWDLTLSQRLTKLRPGTIRVGYFYEVPDSGTFRYRAYNMAQTLNRHSKTYSASYFFLSDLPLVENFADYVDVFVLVRFRFGGGIGRLIDHARGRGKKVVFDIDDLLFSAEHAATVAATLNFGLDPGLVLDNWFALATRLGETLRVCDGAFTTTPTLAHHIQKESDLTASVLPNFLNDEQLEISREVRSAPANSSPGFTIGYFSGSKSHARDFAIAAPGIAEFLRAEPTSRLVVAGILDIPDDLAGVTKQISRLPFMDYLSLQSEVAKVDLNIVPLQLNPFTDSKSELKYFESAVVDTPTLASPSEVFARVIEHGVNGWIAHAPEWEARLAEVASLGVTQRQEVAQEARRRVLATYTGKNQMVNIEKALEVFSQ